MADEIIKTALLDRHMKEAFDWSDRDTMKTEEDMLPFLKDSDDKIEAFINENLKK